MLVKLGLHRGGARIYIKAVDLPQFEAIGYGVKGGHKGCLHIEEDHVRLCQSRLTGGRFAPTTGKATAAGWDYVICDYGHTSPLRCRNFVTTAQWFGKNLVVDALLPHLLPWPKETDTGEAAEHILANLEARMESAAKHTGSRRIAVPSNVLDVLDDAQELRLLTEWKL